MNRTQGLLHGLSEHELSEIRMLIEERTGICFDASRERFLSTRVEEHLREKNFERGTDLLRAMRKSNLEYESLLERLLTQETSFFRYPSVYEAFEKRVLPELHVKKFWTSPRTLRIGIADGHGDRIGFLAGRTAGAPDTQSAGAGPEFLDVQLRQDALFEGFVNAGIAEETGFLR